MAVTVTGNVAVSLNASDQRTAVTGAANETGTRSAAVAASWAIATGVAAGLADKIWSDTRTVGSAATDVIDLATILTNAFGSVETFAKLRAIVIAAASTNTTALTITRPAAATGVPLFAAISDALAPLNAGGFFVWCDPAVGVVVTAATGDLLHVVNSGGGSATYSIAVVGTSA
jgi:hypothetical protein